MNGPFGGHVQAIAQSGATLVIGTHGGGAWRSIDGGVSWTAAGPGISTPFVYALAPMGPRLFAGCPGCGAFVSTDAGVTWNWSRNALPSTTI